MAAPHQSSTSTGIITPDQKCEEAAHEPVGEIIFGAQNQEVIKPGRESLSKKAKKTTHAGANNVKRCMRARI